MEDEAQDLLIIEVPYNKYLLLGGHFSMPIVGQFWMPIDKEVITAFNMGLETALFVLEKEEGLSVDGRRFLIEELKKQIKNRGRL